MAQLYNNESLLVIIPAYNEEGAIQSVIEDVKTHAPHADILVIDDGSADKTADAARRTGVIVLQHPFNLGIGGAMQTGLKYGELKGYDYVVRLDGDGQHNPADINTLLGPLRRRATDMVVGARFVDKGVDDAGWRIPFLRRLGIRLFSWEVSKVVGQHLTDTTSGYTATNQQATQVLATYLPQDYPDVESRIIIHKAGLRQAEVQVQMSERQAGVSSINSWRSVYYAFKVTIAVVTCAFKDIEKLTATLLAPKEQANENTNRTAHHSPAIQPYSVAGDNPTDSQA